MAPLMPPLMLRTLPSPLDAWLARCCGGAPHLSLPLSLSLPERVAQYQLHALRDTLRWCCERSDLYRTRLGKTPPVLHSLADVGNLPFTTVDDVRQWQRLLCVSQGEVQRMVTVQTSGTTGPPKRLAFTARDLQRTREFFSVGMGQLVARHATLVETPRGGTRRQGRRRQGATAFAPPPILTPKRPLRCDITLVASGQRLLVLLPGAERPHGVADLLRQSLPQVDVRAARAGADPAGWHALLAAHTPDALVAGPTQLRSLLEAFEKEGGTPSGLSAGGILSSADPLPRDLQEALARRFACRVLDHYGLTESGYGGGVQCHALDGYHMREADLLVEVVDMHDGTPLPCGHVGEVVITTLGREAMPLLRYRTGDAAAMLPGPCACGSPLRRLGRIEGRLVRQGNHVHVQHLPKGMGSVNQQGGRSA